MNIIFQINGGIGKVIASTAVCRSIKTKYPDANLITVSGYPEVFLSNPNVHRAFGFGQQSYFYQEFIEGKDILVFAHDPYLDAKHLKKEEHLIETWCRIYDVPVISKTGELFLTKREIDFYSGKFTSDKPILLLQTNGGADSEVKYSWARDLTTHVVDNVIHQFKDEYNIVHMRREDQIKYNNTYGVADNFRALTVLIGLSEKRLMMDSFGQHAAAALNKPATVCWVVNSPKVFGYDMHTNILANPETVKPELKGAYLSKYNIGGDLLEFPYNDEREIFNVEAIIEAIKKN